MRFFLAILLSVPTMATAQIGPPPSDLVHWIHTDTDTLSLDPPRYRVAFKIVNEDPIVPIYNFVLSVFPGGSSLPDSCVMFSCESPEGWDCGTAPQVTDTGHWDSGTFGGPPGVMPGTTREGFAFITAGESCCYHAEALGPVFNVVAHDALCIGDGQAVQIQRQTWGRIKTIYR